MKRLSFCLALLLFGLPCRTNADEISQALKLHQQGQHQEAAAALAPLAEAHMDNPKVQYNLGTLRYLAHDVEKAQLALQQALAVAGPDMQARTAYNLGNAYVRSAEALTQQAQGGQAIAQALDHYRKAQGMYRLAMQHDPQDADAKMNHEIVQQRIQALEAMQRSQQQSQDSQQNKDQANAAQSQQTESHEAQQSSSAGQQAQQQQPETQSDGAQQQAQQQPGQSQQRSDQDQQDQNDQQASATQPAAGDQAQEPRHAAAREPAEGDQNEQAPEVSKQEALWILDSMRQEEQALPLDVQQGQSREPYLGRDW